MGIIGEALEAAAQQAVTRPLPKSAPAQMRHLVKAAGGTRPAAALLGISQRTVERYVRGQIRHPRPQLAARLEGELRRRWQPGKQRQALRRAQQAGIVVETRARFGYTAPGGSTDDPRVRLITRHLPGDVASPLIDAHTQGAPEHRLRQIVADGLAHAYFRDGGRRAAGLEVEFTDLDYLEVDL